MDADRLREADGILNLRAQLDRETIGQLSNCRIIARYGIGVDNVAVDAATERGVLVTNVPEYCVEEAATHAISLLLQASRELSTYDRLVAAGSWDRDVGAPLHRLSTRTVGLVGIGSIGEAVCERLRPFGVDILISDPYLEPETVAEHGGSLVEFEELLERADYVSVHSPLTPETRNLIDEDAFEQMRSSAILINVSRRPIVNTDALLAALEAGEIAGAGLDVLPEEPPATDAAIRARDDVLVTPHVAWHSEEANDERRRTAAENVRAALTGERPENVVND